ncbi:Rhamnogalacturonase B, N-terminal-domain-containing protein [Mycena polygramma]|nr:Rhamnogalacturonase B, N-terminal-domain-containing protein [Mycena polygramma]
MFGSAATLFSALVALSAPLVSGFGLAVSGKLWTVQTDGGLVLTVQSTNGDITSMIFNGIQTQNQTKFSQISSGLGSASCSWVQTGNENNYVKITCATSTLTQYYVAQRNAPAIHMATFTTAEPTVGELRFIARLAHSALPNGIPQSSIVGGTAIEASDVYLVGGQTRSKCMSFVSAYGTTVDPLHGVTGSGVGAWMIIPNTGYESSSGGPFFKDINNQGGYQQELYFLSLFHDLREIDMNSGHTETEAFRQGLHGPYALWFTTGAAPSPSIDPTFWAGLGAVSGLVLPAARGLAYVLLRSGKRASQLDIRRSAQATHHYYPRYGAKATHHLNPSVFRDWYTAPIVPQPWSCDWADWVGTLKWCPYDDTDQGSLPIETELNGPFRLPAPLKPIVFWDDEYRLWEEFAFECGGQYYFHCAERESVRRYHGRYASPAAFLEAELATFALDAPVTARYLELFERVMRWHKDHYPWTRDEEGWEPEKFDRLWQDFQWEHTHPPANGVYTEIFPEKEKYRVMVPKVDILTTR